MKALSALSFLTAIAALSLQQGQVEAKITKCRFTIGNKTYINGPCRIDSIEEDGSFAFNDLKMETTCTHYDMGPKECSMAKTRVTRKGTFGQLVITSPGRAVIYWNGGSALHAYDQTDPVTKNGVCWFNKEAELCTW